MITSVKGIVGTPVTPFTADNRVDGETFQRLVDFLIRQGINVLGHPMHVGENISMSGEERRLLTQLAVEAVQGRVPVFINTSLPGTDEVVALSRHAQSLGVQGVIVISPYFWEPPAASHLDHFVTVASSIDISLIAYNYPERLGVTITPEMVAELIRRCPNFVGLKDASFEMRYFTEVCRVAASLRPEFGVFSGLEYTLPAMAMGGGGSFSAIGEIAPRLVKSLYDACASGDFKKALPLQWKVSHLYSILSAGFPAYKVAMQIMGRPCGKPRKPIPVLDSEAARRIESQMKELGLLDEEPYGWG
jgi:4-hydroxy-tetrahydrodipicolinate synthase